MKIYYDFIFNGDASREEIIAFGYTAVDDRDTQSISGHYMIHPKAAIAKNVQKMYSISNKNFADCMEFDEVFADFVKKIKALPFYVSERVEHISWGNKGFKVMKENAEMHGCEELYKEVFYKMTNLRPQVVGSLSQDKQQIEMLKKITLDELIMLTTDERTSILSSNREKQAKQLYLFDKERKEGTIRVNVELLHQICNTIADDPARNTLVDEAFFAEEKELLDESYIDAYVNQSLSNFLLRLEGLLGKMIRQRFEFSGINLENYKGKPIYLRIMMLKRGEGQYPNFKFIFRAEGKELPAIKIYTDNATKTAVKALIQKSYASGRVIPYKGKNRR